MLLYLLRHGDSQNDPAIRDQDRALTPSGVESVKRMAQMLRRWNLEFDAVYSSPLLRAQQTAKIIIEALERQPSLHLTDSLRVGAEFSTLFDLLNTHSPQSSILLVGHEPYFSHLVSALLVGNLDAKVEIRKASLCCVESSFPVGSKSGMLKWLLPPQMMDR